MSAVSERYDRNARLYERWWAPVIAPGAARLLDRVDPFVRATIAARGSIRVLDLGTGTGALAVDAAQRWPQAQIVALDVARGMLAVARRRAATALGAGRAADMRWVRSEAHAAPLDDASVDLIVSSFVLQLVPDRRAALLEALRVLAPGGRIAFVTWLLGRDGFAPADEFDEAVYDVGIDEPEPPEEIRAGDFPSARAAASQLRRAGFRSVSAEVGQLDQAWTLDSYLAYKCEYDELDLFEDLDVRTADRLRRRARERMSRLPVDAFRWRPPIVYGTGERPR